MSFIKKVTKTLISECGYESGQSILVACSGGADSVALLRFLHSRRERLKIPRLGVFHLNHGLRGDEALADEEFVRKLTGELGLIFYPFREDVSAYAAKEAVSVEMAGRRLRYERLNKVCRIEGYELAALGHTATDNVEWILLSLIRGRIEPLLWGIPARRERYIRPLIRCTRDEIIGYLKRLSQPCREDSSNTSFSYDRNRIRHRIIPLLKEENPSLEETVSRTLILGDFQKAFLDSRARELMDSLVINAGQGRELDTSKLSRYNPVTQLHILRLFVPWLRTHDALAIIPFRAAKGTKEVSSGRGERLFMVYDRLVVEPSEGLPMWEPVVLRDEVRIPGLRWSIKVCIGVTRDVAYEGDDAVFFDARLISPPLEVRPWQEGDRMVPFGRSGAVKLKRIFADRKVPSRMRRYWPLVCKGDKIIWIAGLVRSNASPVTAKTRKVTILTLLRGEDGQ